MVELILNTWNTYLSITKASVGKLRTVAHHLHCSFRRSPSPPALQHANQAGWINLKVWYLPDFGSSRFFLALPPQASSERELLTLKINTPGSRYRERPRLRILFIVPEELNLKLFDLLNSPITDPSKPLSTSFVSLCPSILSFFWLRHSAAR